jgi:hypothetical protein
MKNLEKCKDCDFYVRQRTADNKPLPWCYEKGLPIFEMKKCPFEKKKKKEVFLEVGDVVDLKKGMKVYITRALSKKK